MPEKLGRNFKSVKVICNNGHEVARYRKPKPEWGNQTYKLWLLRERLGSLTTEPPILTSNPETGEPILDIPDNETSITCGDESCLLEVGVVRPVHGVVALVLNKNNLKRVKG